MHIIHGELRKAPFIKENCGQDGQSTMFAIELSEMIKDYKTGEKTYTNYRAVLFAKSQAHRDYYQSALVENNFIVVNCEKLKINVSECGQYIKLDMENARLEGSGYIANNNQNQQQAPQQQGGFQQQQPNYQQSQQQPSQQLQQKRQQAQQAQQAPQQKGGFNNQQPQHQGGYQNQPGEVMPQDPAIDFDDDIPFNQVPFK